MSDQGRAAYAVLRQVRPLTLQAARAVMNTLHGEPVTMGIRAPVDRLDDQGPQTVPQIAVWLDVSRRAVQRVVDDAHVLGHVEVRDNAAHRRSHLIALTPRGQAAFQHLHADEPATLETVAAEIEGTDLLTCAAVLERLTDALAARITRANPRGSRR